MPDKELIIFDLDGTLAPSKSPLESTMAGLLFRLLAKKKVAVISGGRFAQFETQFLAKLPHGADNMTNMIILPTSGTAMYTWKGEWHKKYAEVLSEKEKTKIINALKESLKETGFVQPERIYGEQIEDRETQITFSALGQTAPLELKKVWDPDHKKRDKIVPIMQAKLPEFDVRIGGTTTIDTTKRGVNKAYGIYKLEKYTHIPISNMLFVGDALFPGGNDYPARSTGIECIEVKDEKATEELIRTWLESVK